MSEQPALPTTSRRAFMLNEWAKPAVLVVAASSLIAWWARRDQRRHSVSVSISQSNNGVAEVGDQELLLGGGLLLDEAIPATPAIPATEFSNTGLIRNDGDYSEEEVMIQTWFSIEPTDARPIAGLSLDASSALLLQTIATSQSAETDWHYQLLVPRLNPEEWVSVSSTWSAPITQHIEVRSTEVSNSESV